MEEWNYQYPFKTKPYDHQLKALALGWKKREYGLFMEMGCVDSETEYLTPTGWKKFKNYNGTDKVAQYTLDGKVAFIDPIAYVKKPCPTMYHYKGARALDQMYSPDHRLLVLRRDKSRKSPNDLIFEKVADYPEGLSQSETTPEKLNSNPSVRMYSKTEAEGCHGSGIPLTDSELRVQIAFHADGSYGTRDLSSITPDRKGGIRVKHLFKKERIRHLLSEAGIAWVEKEKDGGFTSFSFKPPLVSKTYGTEWWAATEEQKLIILDEVWKWDGSDKPHRNMGARGRAYSSIHKADADFIQFCSVTTGTRASVRSAGDGTFIVRQVGTGRSSNKVCFSHKKVKQVPSTDGYMYCFSVPSTYLFLRRNGHTFVTGNTGKTKVTIDNMAMLYDLGKINSAFIIAPKGVYHNWYNKEIPEHLPSHIPYKMALWRSNLNKQTKEDINALFEPTDDLTVFIINVDALITKKGYPIFEKFMMGRNVFMVCDESTILKTPSAQRTKAAVKLSKHAAYRRILTGSPVTKSPLDIYSQCAFLNENLLGHSSYYSFRNKYAVMDKKNFGGRSVSIVAGYKNVETLQKILGDFTYRVTKDECLDLPDKIFMKREFEMSKEQKKVYEQMRRTAIAFLEDGEATTTHVITQLLRLHQISCGFLPLDDGGVQELKNSRTQELMETLNETKGKVIIWANYRHDIFLIKKALEKGYGPDSVVTYFGDTKDDERKRAVTEFQDTNSPVRFFLGNTQTGGYGITLTSATTVIYYSNNYDLEKRLQSEDRAHRIGQHHPVTYIDLMCKDTVDEKIITALRSKINMARAVTGDDWKEWI